MLIRKDDAVVVVVVVIWYYFKKNGTKSLKEEISKWRFFFHEIILRLRNQQQQQQKMRTTKNLSKQKRKKTHDGHDKPILGRKGFIWAIFCSLSLSIYNLCYVVDKRKKKVAIIRKVFSLSLSHSNYKFINNNERIYYGISLSLFLKQ